jgi:type I restriction enzyme, R subunit
VDGHDVCRVHVEPSGAPTAEVTVTDQRGQFPRAPRFFIRLNNGTRAIEDEVERQRYIAQRWTRP